VLLGADLGHLVVTRERARERSERTTRALQQSLMPASVPAIDGCELAVRFLPAEGELVGGDFYDVYETGEGRWTIVLGDVCGKGAAAAALSAMARWTLRSYDHGSASPADALHALNTAMIGHRSQGRFITIAHVSLALEPGGARAMVACAGHPAPVVVPARGEPAPVPADGDLLGVWPSIRLHTAEVQLRPGDSLVLYTDGVTDQGPQLRRAPHQALGGRPPGASADQLAGIMERLARDGAGTHRDDIAILAVRFLGEGLPRTDIPPRTLTRALDRA
jgi:serine phosphatase RsbU (regulator of sigma subunit)